LNKQQTIASWILRVVVAVIYLQTLFFKFSGAAESVEIFTKLGLEPWGRIGSGVGELIAAILILVPATVPVGALMSLGVISGAILSHLFVLGIVVQDDGGLLFGMAVGVFALSAAILVMHRGELTALKARLLKWKAPDPAE
jgi:uncharacterized membrane protein YphA (DoxX/SURF4 family)